LREPAGDAQREQRRPGHASERYSSGSVKPRTKQKTHRCRRKTQQRQADSQFNNRCYDEQAFHYRRDQVIDKRRAEEGQCGKARMGFMALYSCLTTFFLSLVNSRAAVRDSPRVSQSNWLVSQLRRWFGRP